MTTTVSPTTLIVDDKPKPKVFREKIGVKEFELSEVRLDVFQDVMLWQDNPRLQPFLPGGNIQTEDQLEHFLTQSRGYSALASSIKELGQMEPIYVWRKEDSVNYLTIEGATRVTVLRELARRFQNRPEYDRYRLVTAKVLPYAFTEEDRAILLARIHVRGSGVRQWERYTQAKFVWETVNDQPGRRALMSSSELADHMGKSVSWVTRLKDAYEFARKFVDHVDDESGEREALEQFSTLEEIARSVGFGPKIRDYGNADSDKLRGEVFDMVRNEVFKEYRDARFMQRFFDDEEKWAQLKSHERHIANRLAVEINAGNTSLKGRIDHLYGQVERALDKNPEALGDDDLEDLQMTVALVESRIHVGDAFRFRVRRFVNVLQNASLADVKSVADSDLTEIDLALGDIRERRMKFAGA